MEHVRKIMEIMDDEMFPIKNEWAYVKISNELKQLHLKLKKISIQEQGVIDPSARIETRYSATIDPSAPPRIIRDAWRDLRTIRLRPRR
jgi:hypothetical protein